MQRWKIPAVLGLTLLSVVVLAGPWIRSPFARPAAPPPVVPVSPDLLPPISEVLGPVSMEIMPSHRALSAQQTADMFLAVRLTAQDTGAVERPPLNLAIVLDRSGSMMSANKIDFARKAARLLVDQLTAKDRVALIAFGTDVDLLVPSAPVADPAALRNAIDRIEPTGQTNLSGGFERGCEEVFRNVQPGQINRVLLMTDGLANNGETDATALARLVARWHEKGVSLSTFGLGSEFNEDLLQAMAETGCGQYHFIANPQDMTQVYGSELKAMMKTAARNAVLRIKTAAGIELADVYGYAPGRDENGVTVGLGDLYGGQVRKVVMRLKVPASALGQRDLATVALGYRDVAADKLVQAERAVAVTMTDDRAQVLASRDLRVLEMVETAQAAVSLDQAMRLVQSGRKVEAQKILEAQILRTTERNATVIQSRNLGLVLEQVQAQQRRMEAPASAETQSLDVKAGKALGLQLAR